MKSVAKILVIVFSICTGVPLSANAVSWSPLQEERSEKAAKGIMIKGNAVCLFQSGTADVKKAISIGDVLVVYRENKLNEPREVGKIKVN